MSMTQCGGKGVKEVPTDQGTRGTAPIAPGWRSTAGPAAWDDTATDNGVRDPWRTTAPRRDSVIYSPGVLMRDEGDRMLPELRAAVRNIELANLGMNRTTVTEQTERVLESDGMLGEVYCAWLAILALHYTGDLVSADAQCERLARDPVWAASPRHQDLLTVLRAHSSLMSGDAAWSMRLAQVGTLPPDSGVADLSRGRVADRGAGRPGRARPGAPDAPRPRVQPWLSPHLPDRVHVLAARGHCTWRSGGSGTPSTTTPPVAGY